MVFSAVLTADANDEYRTITPQMLKEQMPQQTQLFQPNTEDTPPNSYNQYNQYSNTAPPESHAHSQNENHYRSPSQPPSNYGYWVRHDGSRGAEPRDAGHSMASVYHDYDPEHIGICFGLTSASK